MKPTQYAFVTSDGQIAYILSPGISDQYTTGQQLGDYLVIGIDGDIDQTSFIENYYYKDHYWIKKPEKPSIHHKWDNYTWVLDLEAIHLSIRAKRNALLSTSDWTVLPDSPLSEEEKTKWIKYRKELRELNIEEYTSYEEVTWPTI